VDALLPDESEVSVYRILQEALSNVVKHADASQVRVAVGLEDRAMRVVVEDDGRGFDADRLLDAADASRGLGLTGFQERVKLLDGRFECRSAPGEGTRLTFEISVTHFHPDEETDSDRSCG
jgi:signal transduction histidine kinase